MIDLTQPILDRNGIVTKDKRRVIEDGDYVLNEYNKHKEEEIDLTLGAVITNCLLKCPADSEEDVNKYYNLFLKMEGAKEIELTEEELKIVKEVICQFNSVYFAGKILSLINK